MNKITIFFLIYFLFPINNFAQIKSKVVQTPVTNNVKKDIANPSLKTISVDQQLDAVKAIINYASKDAMHDFFRLYKGNVKSNIFPPEVIMRAGSFGYMFTESEESANSSMKTWVQSINFNLQKPLTQLMATIIIAKPIKVLQGGVDGISNFLFTTYDAQLQSVIQNAVDATFIELSHQTNTKSFFPMVAGYDFGDLDHDARPYFTNFIKTQLKARFVMEEFLLRDNPAVANNVNVMKIFGNN